MPFRAARTAYAIGALAAALVGSPRATNAAASDTIITRLVALPLSDRASLLVELKKPVPLARETKSDAQSVVVEAGPIDGAVQALDLTPAGTTPLLGSVSVAAVTTPSGQSFLRITVQLRAPASHRVRLAGSRVYLDLAPLAPRARPGDSGNTGSGNTPGALDASDRRPTGGGTPPPAAGAGAKPLFPAAPTATAPVTPAAGTGNGPVGPPGVGDEATDTAYRALQTDVSKRANALVPRADVKGILALIDDTKRRDERLGRKRPDVVDKLLEEVNRRLDEARLRRLELDAAAFEKQGQRTADPPR